MERLRRFIVLLVVGGLLAACGGTPAATDTPTAVTDTPAEEIISQATVDARAEPPVPTEAPTTEPTVASTTESTAEPMTESTAEPTTAPEETAAGTDLSDEELRAALQETVDTWSQAYADADAELLRSVIDPKSFALRRTQEGYMTAVNEALGGQERDWSGTVGNIRRRDHGYVQADVDIGGQLFPFTFKQVDGQWLLSEPRRAELGEKQELETDHFIFEYYPWDEAVATEIVQLMEEAHELVVERMGKAPDQKSLIRLNPTTELGRTSGGVLAFYRRGAGSRLGQQEMVINSPDSFGVVAYDPAGGWQDDLGITLAHEYVHLVNDCCFTPIFRQNDWMTEGIAEYISEGGVTREAQIARAVQNDAIIPIETEADTPGAVPHELASLSALERDRSLGYGLASSLVDYIVRNYGGLEGYWKLVGDYDKTQNFDQSLQNVLGITLEEFERGWREDLEQRYGG